MPGSLDWTSSTPRSAANVTAPGKPPPAHCRLLSDQGRFVEYETATDLQTAVEKLDRREFKGQEVKCTQDVSDPPPPPPFKPRAPYGGPGGPDDRGRDRYRSRSPMGRRGGGYPPAPYDDYYDRRGPPRGYSPRRDDYRRRTPPPRDFYDSRDRYGHSSPLVEVSLTNLALLVLAMTQTRTIRVDRLHAVMMTRT